MQAANKCDDAFTTRGFDNIKKAHEKCLTHDTSASHTEAIMIWSTVSRPTVAQQLSNESAKILAEKIGFAKPAVSNEIPSASGHCIKRTF